jgi:anion-transporting  ArsA/GET3 family ATPase
MSLRKIVDGHRVIVCVGSGGVGKTTTAAALGLWGAAQGRRAVVITIDPARRLATSLGLGAIGREPRDIPRQMLEAHGLHGHGTVAAMMLDQKGAWDALVERHAPTPEVRDRVLANAFYQSLSQTFAGSYEYMAVEELTRLYEESGYDMIVVDTPPTKHALDFLEAPRRLDDFLDRGIIRWFVRPYVSATWSGMRVVNRTVNFVFQRLEQATGIKALVTISEFFTAMSSLFEGFHARVERAYGILQGSDTAFLLVTSPEEQVLSDAEFLSGKMAELHMPLKGVVFNRAHAECPMPTRASSPGGGRGVPSDEASVVRAVVEEALSGGTQVDDQEAIEALVGNFLRYQTMARGEALRTEAFTKGLRHDVPSVRVPNFPHDLHDIAALVGTHRYLFAT